jgi:probable addiction module antidote protein
MGKISFFYCVVATKAASKMISEKQESIGRSITSMRNYETLSEITEEYLRNNPEEIDSFISVLFEEYAQDGDTAALLSALRVVCRVKGLSSIAEYAGMSRRGVQKALSEDGDPRFGSVNAIMHAMGYWLAPHKLQVL